MRTVAILILSTVGAIPCHLAAQTHDVLHHAAPDDSAYRAMQKRGQTVMGVDQHTSTHSFASLPDGGRIELQRDGEDPVSTTAIRAHLRGIAKAFADGDFSAPFAVHEEAVPGVSVMRERRSAIRYDVDDLPRGAALRIHSADAVAIEAIHAFLAYQRREHRAGPAMPAH